MEAGEYEVRIVDDRDSRRDVVKVFQESRGAGVRAPGAGRGSRTLAFRLPNWKHPRAA